MGSVETGADMATPEARFRLSLFGGFKLSRPGGEVCPLSARRERALLAYLALSPNCRQKRRTLATFLWGDGDDPTLLDNLRTCLWGLRKALGDTEHRIVVSDDDGIALDARAFEVDVWSFRQLARQPDKAALETAVSLYTGEFLDSLEIESEDFQSWVRDEAARFRDSAIDVLDRLSERLAEGGEADRAIDTGQRVLTLDPLHERAVRRLMLLYADSGRRGAAFQLYRSLAETLKAELNAEPEAETRRLLDEISRGHNPRLPSKPPAIEAAATPTSPLAAMAEDAAP